MLVLSLAAALAGAAGAADGAGLAPERSNYVGTAFARDVESTLIVVNPLRRTLQPFLAFEATCRGDRRIGTVWSANVRTRERLRLAEDGSFDQTLTARKRGVGPLTRALGRYTWRLRGSLTDANTISARISGTLEVRQGDVTVRCSARTPAALALRLDQTSTSASSTRLPSGSRR